ncbi:MAG: alpha-2-macroglobulin family protein [Bacteroidetes bacterium]|nr:alpha-2-macroglobulin family protein [Bacteroidota bacterium]MBS1973390.1 alpha-2-macroglobulin family protein [Bacteroidota bacterium]
MTVGITFLFSCNRNTVNLDYTNAKDEVEQLQNLTFRFSKPLVKDSLLDQWDSTEYISFEPKIQGRFRWEHPDELVFSPSKPLQPATTFKAKFNADLLQYVKYAKITNADNVSFHTANLALENINASWVLQDESSSTALPQLDLMFNYPVNPNSLKDKLQLAIAGQPVSYNMQTLSASNKISLRLLNLKMQDEDYEASVSIDKGLVPEGGINGMNKKTETKAVISSPFVLHINDVATDNDGSITVTTSQQVVSPNIASFISITPSVKFTVEAQDDGFIIHSDRFDVSKSYQLSITKGLKGRIGGLLKEDYNGSIAFGQLEPSISFASNKGIYLSQKGEKNMEVKITNVEKVKLVVSKIYENNLLDAQRNGYYPSETNNDHAEENYDYGNYSDATVGDIIYQQEIETQTLPKFGNSRLLHFNIDDKLPDFKGIYHIMLRSTKDNWVRDSRFISLSDIGLIAKEGNEKILVFANSIRNTTAIAGVNITAYGANNQLLGMGATNANGVAEIAYMRKEFTGFKPAMIIAKTANDFNYLPFNTTRVNTSRFEVGGRHSNSTGLDAFVYEERDIYRPGEQINFSVIVRDKQWKSPGEIPMKLKFLFPNGKELRSFRKNLNDQGSVEGNINISASAITGTYSLEVYTSNDVLLTTQPFRVEEFVPDRIKVTAKLDKPFLEPGDAPQLSIHAANFFGPPAANRNYECETQVKQKYFSSKKYNNYDFGIANPSSLFDKVVREGKTDNEGNAIEKYEVMPSYKNNGLLQASFYATVFDETGRPVSRNTTVDIFTQKTFFGIASNGYYWYALNQPVEFGLIALDKDGKLLSSAEANVQVVKHEYRTVLIKSGSYFRYESQKEDKLVTSEAMAVGGEGTKYVFVPKSPGDYELRIYVPGSNTYVKKDFYSYGYWGGDNSSFQVNNEGNIDIETDKESYYSGEKAKALFKAPFGGRMLVTMETDKVISYQYVDIPSGKRTASLELPLAAEEVPNVYITATLFKPHDVSDIPLTVAHGYQSIRVEEKGRKIPVEIIAEKTVRSRTHQKVKIKAEANSMVTLAAVDNGVLQVSDFATPDPYGHFYAKRALEVTGYDLYPLLFPEIRSTLSSTGGDMESDMKKRVNPMPAKRFKIMSYWSGLKKTNSNGEAEFEFDIPQFSGEVRLMAVSYKNQSFGSADKTMTVADPIVLSTTLPRFLSPNDEAIVPVTITNTTLKNVTASAIIKASGPVKILGQARQTFVLLPNSESRLTFSVIGQPEIGLGKVTIEVNGLSEKFIDETDISVRPAASLQKTTGSGFVKGGATVSIHIGTSDYIPSSIDYNLVVSRSPAMEFGKYLSALVQYPYGCTEQIVSAAFPQLYFGDIAGMLHTNKAYKANANYNVQEAIRKIKMRQLYNGSVTLWDNEGSENWWATIYAAHFLLEAKNAGFDVDKSLLGTMLSYINNRLKKKETITYYYNRNQNKKIVPKEQIYGLYVLALAGQPNISSMNYYKANPQLLALDSKYLLAAAYALSGDKNSFKQFLPAQFTGEESVAETGGSFYSDIRDEAIALDVLIDVDPSNQQIPLMAKHVAEKLNHRSWYSTQELAFSFIALGKINREALKSNATADIKVNGKTVASMNGSNLALSAQQLKGTNIEIAAKGNGKLYYYWEAEGISSSGDYKEEDSYLKVRKRFYDRYGKPISGNTFKQNDLVIMQISLDKSFSGNVDNIVITDMLPAGFEIENPRTKEIPGMDWIKNADAPTAIDVRDDRISLFANARSNRQVYYYAVRAVSPGTYKMGPVSADAMYNGEYHSYNGAGTIKVLQ